MIIIGQCKHQNFHLIVRLIYCKIEHKEHLNALGCRKLKITKESPGKTAKVSIPKIGTEFFFLVV